MKRALVAVLALLVFAGGGAAWLLATATGNGVLLARIAAYTGAQIEVGQRRGSVLGRLEWKDLVYEDRFVRASARRLLLDWHPAALWHGELAVGDLDVQGLDLQLKPQPPGTASDPAPPLTRLAVDLDLRRIALQDLRLWTAGAAEPIAVARGVFIGRWAGERIEVTRLELDYAPLGRIDLQGSARLTGRGIELEVLKLIAPFPAAALGFVGYAEPSELQLGWRRLRWPLDPAAEPLLTSAQGRLHLQGPWNDLGFALQAALGAQGSVAAQGRWTGALDATLDWQRLGWPLTASDAPLQSERGQLRFKGLPEGYEFDLDAALLARSQAGQLRVQGRGDLNSVDLARAEISAGASRIAAAGAIAWAPQPQGALQGQIEALDPALLAPAWPGSINGEFTVSTESGSPAGAVPALRFTLGLRDSRLRGYPLKLDAEGRYAAQRLDLARLHVESGGSLLEASGRASPPYDLQARLLSPDLGEIAPGAAGEASLQARFSGTLDHPHLIAEGQLVQASWRDYAVASLQLDADLDYDGELRLDLQARQLAAAALVDELKLDGRGRRDDHRLALSAALPQAALELVLAGGYDAGARRWQGRIEQAGVAPRRLAPWALEAPAALSLALPAVGLSAELGRACWSSAPGRACIEAELGPASLRAGFEVQDLALAYFQPLLPPELRLEGAVDGSGLLRSAGGGVQQARAELRTSAGAVQLGEQRFAFLPASLLVSDDGEGRAALRFPLQVGGIELDARLAPGAVLADRALSGELRLDFPDLGFVAALSPELSAVAGQLRGRYELGGRAGAPELQGEAQITGGGFELTRLGLTIRELAATLRGSPGGRLALAARARSGEGSIALDGRIEPGPRLALQLRGDNVQLANLPEARVWASPDLQFQLDGRQAFLRGSVIVPRAELLYTQRDSGVAPSEDQVIVDAAGRPQEAGDALALRSELRVELGERVRLEALGLKTRLEGSITAIDEPGRETTGHGELRLVEGRYKAYGQDLDIRTGKLLFNGGPIDKPGLDLQAVREPREDVLVGIHVRGTLDKPLLNLYSEPSMTQQQQLSWLLLGRPLEQTGASQDRDMLANAAVALGLGGGNRLAQNLRGGLGLDEVSIGAEPGESSDQAMFTVGKYLSPKLFVSYGVGLFQAGSAFRLLYDLGRGFKLSTESGVATGGDLLYTVERP